MDYINKFDSTISMLSKKILLTGIIFEWDSKFYIKNITLDDDEFQYIIDLFRIQCVLKFYALENNHLYRKQSIEQSRKKKIMNDLNVYRSLENKDKEKIGLAKKKEWKALFFNIFRKGFNFK